MLTITLTTCRSNDKDIRVLCEVLAFVCTDFPSSTLPKVIVSYVLLSISPVGTIIGVIIAIIIVICLQTLIIEVRFTIKGRVAFVRLVIIYFIVVSLDTPRQISGAYCSQGPDGLNM